MDAALFLLETLFQNSADAMAVLDDNLFFIKFNDAFTRYFGAMVSSNISIGVNLTDVLERFPRLKKEILNAYSQAASGKKFYVTLESDAEDDESYYYYELFFTPISQLNQTYHICIIRNLSESILHQRLRLKQQNDLANVARFHAVGAMAAALAHEINQPLAAINIYSYSCLEQYNREVNPNIKISKGLEQIFRLSQHAGEILNRMKNYIRDGDVIYEKTDINALIKHTLDFLDYQKLEIEFALDETLPNIMLDQVKIMQVILNLAQNSIEAFQEQSAQAQLNIQTRLVEDKRSTYIEVVFHDNGPGIPIEIEDKIMTTYFTTKSHGTGLGLIVCRMLVEAHGGKFMIKRSPVTGACIAFTLPVKV